MGNQLEAFLSQQPWRAPLAPAAPLVIIERMVADRTQKNSGHARGDASSVNPSW